MSLRHSGVLTDWRLSCPVCCRHFAEKYKIFRSFQPWNTTYNIYSKPRGRWFLWTLCPLLVILFTYLFTQASGSIQCVIMWKSVLVVCMCCEQSPPSSSWLSRVSLQYSLPHDVNRNIVRDTLCAAALLSGCQLVHVKPQQTEKSMSQLVCWNIDFFWFTVNRNIQFWRVCSTKLQKKNPQRFVLTSSVICSCRYVGLLAAGTSAYSPAQFCLCCSRHWKKPFWPINFKNSLVVTWVNWSFNHLHMLFNNWFADSR